MKHIHNSHKRFSINRFTHLQPFNYLNSVVHVGVVISLFGGCSGLCILVLGRLITCFLFLFYHFSIRDLCSLRCTFVSS